MDQEARYINVLASLFRRMGKFLKKLQCWVGGILQDKYLLLTEFEGRTVSYGPSFFLLDLWPKREARGP